MRIAVHANRREARFRHWSRRDCMCVGKLTPPSTSPRRASRLLASCVLVYVLLYVFDESHYPHPISSLH